LVGDFPPLLIKSAHGKDWHFTPKYVDPQDEAEALNVSDLGELESDEINTRLAAIEKNTSYSGKWLTDADVDLILVVSPKFRDKLERDERPVIQVISGNRESSRPLVRRVRGMLDRWRAQVKEVRLVRHGLSPAFDESVQIIDPDRAQRGSQKS